jgi:glycosyltransferase A (GT-A) superfamily protein (DUF2064 family)
VLVFAEAAVTQRRRKGIARHAMHLLRAPQLRQQMIHADVHFFLPGDRARNCPSPMMHRQRGDSFGQRLGAAAEDLHAAGYERVVIVGSDCPQLRESDVADAVRLLKTHQLVLGPDHRGGCWLIGLHLSDRAVLREIVWQRDTDFHQLRDRARCPSAVAILETKIDIDAPEDVQTLIRLAPRFAPQAPAPAPPARLLSLTSQRSRRRSRWQRPPPSRLSCPAALSGT